MRLANLSVGDSVFVDSNPFVYYFQPHALFGPDCQLLLDRINRHEVAGYTSTHVLTETVHRLMVLEAGLILGWGQSKIKAKLLKNPGAFSKLTLFRGALDTILWSQVRVLHIAPTDLVSAAAISQQIGLLSSDALIVALMRANGIDKLASNDADFDHVPGLTRYEAT